MPRQCPGQRPREGVAHEPFGVRRRQAFKVEGVGEALDAQRLADRESARGGVVGEPPAAGVVKVRRDGARKPGSVETGVGLGEVRRVAPPGAVPPRAVTWPDRREERHRLRLVVPGAVIPQRGRAQSHASLVRRRRGARVLLGVFADRDTGRQVAQSSP